jgi:glycosyltransferase involved in cell wall biosynthesis
MSKNISIVTISQFDRFGCITILMDLIKNQTYYSRILEWIIVDGSKNATDAELNKMNIDSLRPLINIPIKYVEYEEDVKLGQLRNKSNMACTGDVIVCMDDDDYYMPQRVEHAYEELMKSDKLIAGSSCIHIYDYLLDGEFVFSAFAGNHSTNNCMAYKKEYLSSHKHDSNVTHAEETSFTNNFTEPMIQLDVLKTIVVNSHNTNTYNKREIIVKGIYGMNVPVKSHLRTIPNKYYTQYKSIFVKPGKSPYDIVYMAGCMSADWNPTDKTLGGSEQAIVHLTQEWTKEGKKVAVYGKVPQMIHEGVDYFPFGMFPYNYTFRILICWRMSGLAAIFKPCAERIYLDLHDTCSLSPGFDQLYASKQKLISKIFFKSNFHKNDFETVLKTTFNPEQYAVIPNGIRVSDFKDNTKLNNGQALVRNPYRFCYCSCYTRGLQHILQHIWPIIYKHEPKAELHVYYGMNLVNNQKFKMEMQFLLGQPGVMDHGRQPMDMIVREKYMSSYHLYISDTKAETDCISIRESLITGAIPLISNSGVFADRGGIHFALDTSNVETMNNIGKSIIKLFDFSQDNLDKTRAKLAQHSSIVTWEDVAKTWIAAF